MKKLFFILFAVLSNTFAMADDSYSVSSGNLSAFLDNSATCSVEFDYSQGFIGEVTIEQFYKVRGGNWYKDFQKYTKDAIPTFIKVFNKQNKKGMQAVAEGGTHKLVVTVKVFNPYRMSFGMMSSICAAFETAVLTLYDKDGNDVCTIDLSNQTGGTSMSDSGRIDNLYEDFAKDLAKFIKKNH